MTQTPLNSFENIKNLLEQISLLDKGKNVEKNIFSIGAKGYYENPTSDMLAFFCDPNEEHNLGSVMLEALFNCLSEEEYQNYDFSLSSSPQREVFTNTQKRIDLILEGEEWVIILENKIYHILNNPFQEYQNFIESQTLFRNKKIIYVVLSPHGRDSPDGIWQGIQYRNFIKEIQKKLAIFLIEQPFNKWVILLREFILHLESLMSKPSLPEETIDFVLNNLQQIKEVEKLCEKTIPIYHQILQKQLQEKLEQDIGIKLDFWHKGYPALRFFYLKWKEVFHSNSNVVLFLDARINHQFAINYYAHNLQNKDDQELADSYLKKHELHPIDVWDEAKGTIRCYKAMLNNCNNEYVIENLAHKLQIMDDFETNRSLNK